MYPCLFIFCILLLVLLYKALIISFLGRPAFADVLLWMGRLLSLLRYAHLFVCTCLFYTYNFFLFGIYEYDYFYCVQKHIFYKHI